MAGVSDTDPNTSCAHCDADFPAEAAFCPHCGASRSPGRAAGPVLGGYTILRTLGQGGVAVVYLARQESLNRQVAVKVLRHHVEDDKMWRNFRREAQTVARLSGHPNVVTVYTAGRSEAGLPYLVTEYLDRGSLDDVIDADGPLPPTAVAKVGVAVADALTAAHGLGILHRDVKPGNVLLDHVGRVKLGDFGIARLLARQSVTITDVNAFTPEHVAPEILRGEPDGAWSDLYGLASTLATALLGTSPFAQRADERVEALLSRKLMAPPPAMPASVPAALAEPITRALDPDPHRRPSLAEFRRQLAEASDVLGAAVTLVPPTSATDAPAQTVTAPALAHADADLVRGGSLIGPFRRPRPRLLAFPALLVALLAATLAVAAMAGNGGDGDGGDSRTTSPNVVVPTAADRRATPPSKASTPGASASSTVGTPESSPGGGAAPRTDPPPSRTLPAPTTSAPPSTTAPAPTASAPPSTTLPAPTASAPPSTSFPPVTSQADGAPAVMTAPEAETFVRSYYDAVAARNYEASWSQLAPEFQQGKAESYEYYVGFWDDNDIEVGDVELVDADEDRAIVNVELRWDGSTTTTVDQFTLRPGADGRYLIAAQSTVDGD